MEETKVRHAWDNVGKERLRDILSKTRNDMLKKHNKSDVAYLHDLGPPWMTKEVWNELVAYWSTPEWRKRSEAAQANRKIEKYGTITKHTCGSVKIEIHEERMAKQLRRPPTELEVFRATHTNNDGAYIDGKSEHVIENYGSNSESQERFDIDKWVEISGGHSKGRVYGFGFSNIVKSKTVGSSSSHSCTSAHPESSSQPMMTFEQVQKLLEEAKNEVMDKMRREFMSHFTASSHPTTSNSTPPSDNH